MNWVQLDHPMIGRSSSLVYLLLAGYVLLQTERWRNNLQFKVAAALALDIAATTLALFSIANPLTFTPAPDLAEHTEAVLMEHGLDWDAIIALKVSDAIA